jgi:hypothetical protein
LLKIQTPENAYGVTLEVNQNGNNVITTAFKSTGENGVASWINKEAGLSPLAVSSGSSLGQPLIDIITQARERSGANAIQRKETGTKKNNAEIVETDRYGRGGHDDTVRQRQKYTERSGENVQPEKREKLTDRRYQRAYHGSPYQFEKFDNNKIGTGEGNQSFGYGLYVAGAKAVAEDYAHRLRKLQYDGKDIQENTPRYIAAELLFYEQGDKQSAFEGAASYGADKEAIRKELRKMDFKKISDTGHLYESEIPGDDELLDWDKKQLDIKENYKLAEKLAAVRRSARLEGLSLDNIDLGLSGQEIYDDITSAYMEEKGLARNKAKEQVSALLSKNGIKGIRYLDGSRRANGEGAYNYVIFDDKDITDVKRLYQRIPDAEYVNTLQQQYGRIFTPAEREQILEKRGRLGKLIDAPTLEFTGNEWQGKYELNANSAQKYILYKLRDRKYRIKDTNEIVQISHKGAVEILHHDRHNEIHLKSIAFIPDMIENTIFIDEAPDRKEKPTYDKYRYYVTGLNIDNEPYTAKIVIGEKGGSFYYDHELSNIEKGDIIRILLSSEGEQTALTNVKDTTLLRVVNPLPISVQNGNVGQNTPRYQRVLEEPDFGDEETPRETAQETLKNAETPPEVTAQAVEEAMAKLNEQEVGQDEELSANAMDLDFKDEEELLDAILPEDMEDTTREEAVKEIQAGLDEDRTEQLPCGT